MMYKTGHSLIKAKLKETGAPFAGEMSGHIFFGERWYGFDDAMYTAARLLEILSRASRPQRRARCAAHQLLHARAERALRRGRAARGGGRTAGARGRRPAKLPRGRGRHHRRPARRLRRRLRPDPRVSNTTPVLVLRFEGHTPEALPASSMTSWPRCAASSPTPRCPGRTLTPARPPGLAGALWQGLVRLCLAAAAGARRCFCAPVAARQARSRCTASAWASGWGCTRPAAAAGRGVAACRVAGRDPRGRSRWWRRCAAPAPDLRLLLTHGTATGRRPAAALLQAGDVPGLAALRHAGRGAALPAPPPARVGVLMETEIWPNLMRHAERLGVPMVLANARLSERSLAKGGAWPRCCTRRCALTRCWRRRRPMPAACARLRRAAGAGQRQPEVRHGASPGLLARACSGARACTARWCWRPARAKARKAPLLPPGRRCRCRGRCCWWCRATRSASTRWWRWQPQAAGPTSGCAARCRYEWDDEPAARGRQNLMADAPGWATSTWARCRCTTPAPTWRCWAAASRRWAGRT
jgi:hypothetical protein